jgi:hypothetical protein
MSTFDEFPARIPHGTSNQQPQGLEDHYRQAEASFTLQDRALITETARLLMMFAASQKSTNELLLLRTAVGADVPLKPRDIGLFEPTRMPDSLAAIHFIDDFNTAAIYYGEEATRKVLRRCCANTVARSWIAGLDDGDRLALQVSTQDWERLIRRDFLPSKGIREDQARAEKFKWTQNRTPAEYVTSKLTLLRIAGITDHDRVIWEIHDGLKSCPEIQIPLEHFVKDSGNSISEYRRQVLKYQDMAKLQYKFNTRSRAADSSMAPVYYTSSTSSQRSTPHRSKSRCSDVFFDTGRKNDYSKHSRPPTPKPSECRHCREAFPSRSRLHVHLRTTGHHQRKSNRHQPPQYEVIVSANTKTVRERFAEQHAFFGITMQPMATGTPTTTPLGPDEVDIPTPPSVDRFNNTGYEGVTIKERGYPLSPVSEGSSLRFSFTNERPAFPFPLRLSSMVRATSAARRSAMLQLRFASILAARSASRSLRLRVKRKLIHWQAHPAKLKGLRGMSEGHGMVC